MTALDDLLAAAGSDAPIKLPKMKTPRRSSRIVAAVDETVMYRGNDGTLPIPSVCVSCSRCGHSVNILGRHRDSVVRGLATLREECPLGQKNYYREG